MSSPTELSHQHVSVLDFLETILKISELHPDIGLGLWERRADFKSQLGFLVEEVEAHPLLISTDDIEPPSDSLVVVAPSTPGGTTNDFDDSSFIYEEVAQNQAPPILGDHSEYTGDIVDPFDSVAAVAGTSSPATNESAAFPNPDMLPPGIPFKLPAVPDHDMHSPLFANLSMGSLDFDESILGARMTLHEFLLNPNIAQPASFWKGISSRYPRAVELVLRPSRMLEIVYLDDMANRLLDFLKSTSEKDLDEIVLTPELYQRLNAGPLVANCSIKMHCEADVEHAFKVSQGHVVAETMNILSNPERPDRYYPRKGTPGSKPGQSSHAFADVEIGRALCEIKTIFSINQHFISALLDLPDDVVEQLVASHKTGVGFKFDFSYPQSFRDTLGPFVQPVVQIWTQLHEKSGNFGQGSSHEHSFFTIKDPKSPQRLYISRCYQTFPKPSPTSQSRVERPTESGLYTMLNLYRIANKPEYADSFLRKLREDMETPGNLVPVQSRDVNMAGNFNSSSTQLVQTVNPFKGTVGVKYYDQPTSKDGVLRKVPVPNYKELSSSRIDESVILPEPPSNPKPPTQLQAKTQAYTAKYPAGQSRSAHLVLSD
ncbi:hypothetical protein B0H13DRAFT_1873825 [Mycena leptocephala]|nr:hypothetical protein B0H13DRAFT_1873825 [Mycena leptocephala]